MLSYFRCYMKLGSWQEQLQGINEASIPTILECYLTATQHDNTWYKAWHAWAYMNFQTVLFYKNQHNAAMTEEQKAQVSFVCELSFVINHHSLSYLNLVLLFL